MQRRRFNSAAAHATPSRGYWSPRVQVTGTGHDFPPAELTSRLIVLPLHEPVQQGKAINSHVGRVVPGPVGRATGLPEPPALAVGARGPCRPYRSRQPADEPDVYRWLATTEGYWVGPLATVHACSMVPTCV